MFLGLVSGYQTKIFVSCLFSFNVETMAAYITSIEINKLEHHLNMLNPTSNPQDARKALTLALQLVESKRSTDVNQVLPSVTKYISSSDILCKKLAMWFVSSYSGKADLLLLAVNSLMKDCSNPNPVMRCLALKTLTQIQLVEFVEYSLKAVLKGLEDNSAYVRRAAVVSCLKLHRLNPSIVDDHDLIDLLYSLIRDKDPIVVLNCVQVLDEILINEGGIVINKNIAYFLLNNMNDFPEWGIPLLLDLLGKYEPQSEDEVYNIMNLVDCYLQKGSCTTVMQSVRFLLKLIKNMPNMETDVLCHVKDPMLHFLNKGNPELTVIVINFIEEIYIPAFVKQLEMSYVLFLCKSKEPAFVKCKRIQILFKIVNNSNVQDILDELVLYSSSPELCKISIDAIGKIGAKCDYFHDLTTKKLIQMLDVGSEGIKTEVFIILSEINITKIDESLLSNLSEQIGIALESGWFKQNESVLTSLFWLVGEFGERLEDLPYIIKDFLDEFTSWGNSELCCAIVIAVVKLMLKKPAQYQTILGQIFEDCNKYCGIFVKESVSYYYNLLNQDIDIAKKALL